jgi:hypothetical protein
MQRKIDASDIIPAAEYGKLRAERRRQIAEIKKNRRMEVGPFATFYFESFDTMLHQVHEMLFIEKGGAEQLPDELAAYNPLIPTGSELVATVMFEIEDAVLRGNILRQLTGVEDTLYIEVGGERSVAVPLGDSDRTADDGENLFRALRALHIVARADRRVAQWRGAGDPRRRSS